MDVQTLLGRALSALEKKTKYISPGTVPRHEAASWPVSGAATDCSGYLMWCLRISRKTDHPFYLRVNGGWLDTAAIHADGMASVGYFNRLDVPKRGSMLVYPDYQDAARKHHDGHIGIVVSVTGGQGPEAVTEIIHCSLGGYRKHGDAIQLTPPSIWTSRNDAICVWYSGLIE